MNTKYKAVIFDMDGVIINSEKEWFTDELKYISTLVPQWNHQLQRSMIGRNVKEIYYYLYDNYDLDIEFDDFSKNYNQIAKKIYSSIELEDGLLEFIDKIKLLGFKIGLCTSSPDEWVKPVFDRHQLWKNFDVILTSSNYKGKGKPEPEVYFEILSRMGINNTDAIVIEDSINGIKSARSAGLLTIGYKNNFNAFEDIDGADLKISNFSELNMII